MIISLIISIFSPIGWIMGSIIIIFFKNLDDYKNISFALIVYFLQCIISLSLIVIGIISINEMLFISLTLITLGIFTLPLIETFLPKTHLKMLKFKKTIIWVGILYLIFVAIF